MKLNRGIPDVAKQDPVISHWDTLVEDFETSPLSYYATLRSALERRQIPSLSISEVEHRQGSAMSGNRIYLRIMREHTAFDVCCAPFGTGVFFSWWFVERPLAFRWLYTLGIWGGLNIAMLISLSRSFEFFIFMLLIGLPLITWGALVLIRENDTEDTMLQIPIFGFLYRIVMSPVTYYKIDTTLMYQRAVHNAVLEAIDEVTAAQGVRALGNYERQIKLGTHARTA